MKVFYGAIRNPVILCLDERLDDQSGIVSIAHVIELVIFTDEELPFR